MQTRSWDDQNGQKRYKTEVVANNFQFMESRNGGNSGGSYSGGENDYGQPPVEQNDGFNQAPTSESFNQTQSFSTPKPSQPAPVPNMPIDDDLPF